MPDPIAIIPALVGLLKTLIEGREKRRTEVYNLVIAPVWAQLEEVHEDYGSIFLKASRALPVWYEGVGWRVPGKARELSSNSDEEVQERVAEIKRQFQDWRQPRESIRDQLRFNASDFLSAVRHKEEQRFLLSIVLYFLADPDAQNAPQDSDSYMDNLIDSLTNHVQRSDQKLPTPSAKLANDIARESDPVKLRALFETARQELNDRFFFANARHNAVRKAILHLKSSSPGSD